MQLHSNAIIIVKSEQNDIHLFKVMIWRYEHNLNHKHPNSIWTITCSISVFITLVYFCYSGRSFYVSSPPSLGVQGSAGNETADSIIRSDGKSLCKVFCIITYQSQNSHPQILWVTKHRQLPHYCPPKSSPGDDKEPRERRRGKRRKIKK